MLVHFDTADIAARIKAESEVLRQAALAEAECSPEARKFIEAQVALTDATIIQSQVFADLIGAEMPVLEIVKVFAEHTSNILGSLMSVAPPDAPEVRGAIMDFFLSAVARCATGNTGHRSSIELRGQKAGRA